MTEEFEEIPELLLEVIQILALSPVIWIVVQISQILAVSFTPISDFYFHGLVSRSEIRPEIGE
jgi:hypothetical protein